MEKIPVFAERCWFAISPDGSEHDVLIRVEAPQRVGAGDWGTVVICDPMDPTRHMIPGVDSWQSLHLAMKFAGVRMEHFIEMGWQFYWERGGSAAEASDLFL